MEMALVNRSEQKNVDHPRGCRIVRAARDSRLPAGFIGVIAVILFGGSSVFGQFIINPMKLDTLQIPPGKKAITVVNIDNPTNRVIDQVDLAVVDVVQDANGIWAPIKVGDPNVDRSKLRSCAPWVVLDRQTVRLPPNQQASFNVQIAVPPQTQGHYCAAITAKSEFAPGTVAGFSTAVSIKYVLPIVLEVQGRPLRNEVSLSSVGLRFDGQGPMAPAATVATMGIENKGGTYCRVQGYIRISNLWGGHWRRITETQYSDVGIIPGAKFLLKRDLGRPLPKGEYKLEGFLVVNGQRADQIETRFEFKGDPRAATVHSDAALDFDPRDLMIDAMPGSLRVSRIQVVNASEEPVKVDVELALPEHLHQLVVKDPNTGRNITGEEYGCESWVTVEPSQFQLNGYGRQNLLIKVNVPEKAAALPTYYSVVNLKAKFPDGQAAGTAKGRICVQMKKTPGTPMLHTNTVQVSELAPTKFAVVANMGNYGNTHVLPGCRALVVQQVTGGASVVQHIEMSSESFNQVGNLLPLETRKFSGVLDAARLEAGQYTLFVIAEGDKGQSSQTQNGLLITEANGVKSVSIVPLDAVGGEIKAINAKF